MGAWGLISRIFFSLWYFMLGFIEAAASSLYLFGVSFIVSATMTTGSFTSLKETFTSFITSFSWFWAYSIKGVYTFFKYLTYFLNSSFLYGYLKSFLATFTILYVLYYLKELKRVSSRGSSPKITSYPYFWSLSINGEKARTNLSSPPK